MAWWTPVRRHGRVGGGDAVAAAAAPLTEDPPIAKKPKSEGAALVFGWANKGCDCPRCEKPPAAV